MIHLASQARPVPLTWRPLVPGAAVRPAPRRRMGSAWPFLSGLRPRNLPAEAACTSHPAAASGSRSPSCS